MFCENYGNKICFFLRISEGWRLRKADVEEETSTLLEFDIVNLDREMQDELREAIEREGKLLYEKV